MAYQKLVWSSFAVRSSAGGGLEGGLHEYYTVNGYKLDVFSHHSGASRNPEGNVTRLDSCFCHDKNDHFHAVFSVDVSRLRFC